MIRDEDEGLSMTAYIEFQAFDLGMGRHNLNPQEVQQIGRFTRENISSWADSLSGHEWATIVPIMDFYAVCGDKVVPWTNKDNERVWEERWPNKKHGRMYGC